MNEDLIKFFLENLESDLRKGEATKTFTVRMPQAVYQLLKIKAVVKEITLQEAFIEAVKMWLKNQE